MPIQTVIFSKAEGDWTPEKARSWLNENDLKSSKLDETESSYRFRQFSPDRCKTGSYQTLTENFPAGIAAVSCETED